jgi:putative transposase
MPWETTSVIEQRIQLVLEYRGKRASMTELCRRYGVSRKTGYEWVKQVKDVGCGGMGDRSRKPKGGVGRMSEAVRERIVQMRREHPDRGALQILHYLRREDPEVAWPATSTAHDALRAAGLVKKRKRGAPRPGGGGRCLEPTRPNELWAVDFKGQFKTGDGKYCYPLTISDGYSRFLLACEGLPSIEAKSSWAVFERVLRKYGLPETIHSDNGEPFASRSLGGLSQLTVKLMNLGILIERSRPGHPQDNGRHERMHRTMKAAITHPVSYDLRGERGQLDGFWQEYNHERPHQALGGRTPAELYQPSLRPYPEVPPGVVYPSAFTIRRVKSRGYIKWNGGRLFVSEVLIGQRVGLVQDPKDWLVYFGPVLLGRINASKRRIVPTATMLAATRSAARTRRSAKLRKAQPAAP